MVIYYNVSTHILILQTMCVFILQYSVPTEPTSPHPSPTFESIPLPAYYNSSNTSTVVSDRLY